MSENNFDPLDHEFAAFARRKLEHSAAELDAPTRGRLRAARRRAVNAASGRRAQRSWLTAVQPMTWLPTGAAAAVIALAMTWLALRESPLPPLPTDGMNMQVLTAEEDLDFYHNLEFLLWLDARDATA